MNVGLTGGIASGKSTVSRMFAERGAHIVDADVIAREVVMPGTAALQSIADTFGAEVLHADGSLNRKALGSLIFGNAEAKEKLEAIVHPPIRAEIHRQIAEWNAADPSSLVIVDIPLLYESELDKLYALEEVIVVFVPREVQIARLIERDRLSPKEAELRILSQWPIERKKEMADVVIDNSGTLQQTAAQVDAYIIRKGNR